MEVWEIHPAVVHFPIAFLIGAACYDVYLWSKGEHGPSAVANGLYIVGVLTAAVAAAAGLLAFYKGPASFTDEASRVVWRHIGAAVTQFVLFAVIAIARWRRRRDASPSWTRVVAIVAALILVFAGYEGGYLVYHGATGIEPQLLTRSLQVKQERKIETARHSGEQASKIR